VGVALRPEILNALLKKKKAEILDRWLQLILETYPLDRSTFLTKEKDRFLNPVGQTFFEETRTLYEGLLNDIDAERASASLEKIIQIRTVQDFSPSQAVQFIHGLKQALREKLRDEIRREEVFKEWLELESQIDRLSLLAFDIYTKCREKITEIRINEMRKEKDRALSLIARSGLTADKQ
jgi:hypothetical protein